MTLVAARLQQIFIELGKELCPEPFKPLSQRGGLTKEAVNKGLFLDEIGYRPPLWTVQLSFPKHSIDAALLQRLAANFNEYKRPSNTARLRIKKSIVDIDSQQYWSLALDWCTFRNGWTRSKYAWWVTGLYAALADHPDIAKMIYAEPALIALPQ